MKCKHCMENAGTAFFLSKEIGAHETAEHWHIVARHKAAATMIRGARDLVGPGLVFRMLISGLSEVEEDELEKTIVGQVRRRFAEAAAMGAEMYAAEFPCPKKCGNEIARMFRDAGLEPRTK